MSRIHVSLRHEMREMGNCVNLRVTFYRDNRICVRFKLGTLDWRDGLSALTPAKTPHWKAVDTVILEKESPNQHPATCFVITSFLEAPKV